jgi:hypothetical protein
MRKRARERRARQVRGGGRASYISYPRKEAKSSSVSWRSFRVSASIPDSDAGACGTSVGVERRRRRRRRRRGGGQDVQREYGTEEGSEQAAGNRQADRHTCNPAVQVQPGCTQARHGNQGIGKPVRLAGTEPGGASGGASRESESEACSTPARDWLAGVGDPPTPRTAGIVRLRSTSVSRPLRATRTTEVLSRVPSDIALTASSGLF